MPFVPPPMGEGAERISPICWLPREPPGNVRSPRPFLTGSGRGEWVSYFLLAVHVSRDSGATNAVCLTAADKLRLSLQRDVVA
jgi:hypothetical protein